LSTNAHGRGIRVFVDRNRGLVHFLCDGIAAGLVERAEQVKLAPCRSRGQAVVSGRVTTALVGFHGAFWAVVFLLNVGPDWHRYTSAREVVEVAGTTTALQALVAFVALRFLVPFWLDRGYVRRFGSLLLGLLFIAAEGNILFSYAYLEPAYPESYGKYYAGLGELSLVERLGFSSTIRWIVFSKLPLLFFPAAVLIAVRYYQRQQSVLALREQKRVAELEALKRQLNPHFVFNTLNNIYALAVKQSEQTPEAIAKLSGILDYVLYRCSSDYVSLEDEVDMINDYIALERLRFGERLNVTFSKQLCAGVMIAPLLFLTLIENAFKHGASQQLGGATVDISLTATADEIVFGVSNSKAVATRPDEQGNGKIGLVNLRRQLDLLYPGAHRLDLEETPDRHLARISLKRQAA
jgi:hypothetical protein